MSGNVYSLGIRMGEMVGENRAQYRKPITSTLRYDMVELRD